MATALKEAFLPKGLLSSVPGAPHPSPPTTRARLPETAQTGLCKVFYSNNQG